MSKFSYENKFLKLIPEEYHQYLKKITFFKEDTISTISDIKDLYYILEGEAHYIKHLPSKDLTFPSKLSKGSLAFAGAWLRGEKYDWDLVVTKGPLTVISIPIDIALKLKNENIEFNSYLFEYLIENTTITRKKLALKYFAGTKEILAYELVRISVNNYVYIENLNMFAANLNITPPNFYSTIKFFIKEGLISKDENSIKILNKEKLIELYSLYF